MASKHEETNKETVQRIWELIESNGFDELDDVLAEDVVLRVPGHEEIHGIDGYREYLRTYKTAFPDTNFEVHDMFVDGDVVITHFTWRATHDGEMGGIEATGKAVEQPGMTINRFENGKAVEDINYWDNLDFFQQLGVVESPTG